MRCFWVDTRVASIEGLSNQAQSVLDLWGSQRKPTTKEEFEAAKVFKRKNKGSKETCKSS